MADLTAQRTLVKSPPELWSELSEVESLARHLGELGEIRITRVEPETTVAWEGEQASGTVELEQSGWGTKVTLRATVPEPEPAPEPVATAPEEPSAEPVAAEPEPVEPPPSVEPEPSEPEPSPPGPALGEAERRSLWARLFRRRRAPTAPIAPEPAATSAPEPVAPDPAAAELESAAAKSETPAAEAVEPEPRSEPAAADQATEPEPEALTAERVQGILDGTLDALGQAHHRPFSRG